MAERQGKLCTTSISSHIVCYIIDYRPTGRHHHSIIVVDGILYVWAQDEIPPGHDSEEKMRRLSNIDTFTMSTGLWRKRVTEGVPPLGHYGYNCTTISKNICFFGGYCGHRPITGLCNGFRNSLNMLNINSLHIGMRYHQQLIITM